MAAGFYKLIKILEYETANPDQDAEKRTDSPNSHSTKRQPNGHVDGAVDSVVRPSHSSHTYGHFADRNDRAAAASRPPVPARAPSDAAVHSPAMASADDAYAGLAEGGLHAGQNTAHHEASDSPGMVVNDGLVRRLGRGSSYAA